jgi:hypothetical protein
MGQRPAGITVVSLLVALQGVLGILTGLEASGITSLGLGAGDGSQSAGLADIVIGTVMLLVAFGLFSTQRWAWLVAVVVSILRVVTGILALLLSGIPSAIGISGVVAVVIALVVLWYFLRPDVKDAFDRM